jgi:hypothetical protein
MINLFFPFFGRDVLSISLMISWYQGSALLVYIHTDHSIMLFILLYDIVASAEGDGWVMGDGLMEFLIE